MCASSRISRGIARPYESRLGEVYDVRTWGQISDALRLVRFARGLTQAEVAEAAGLSRTQVSRIETRRADPRASTVARMLRALGVSLTVVPDYEEAPASPAQETPVAEI